MFLQRHLSGVSLCGRLLEAVLCESGNNRACATHSSPAWYCAGVTFSRQTPCIQGATRVSCWNSYLSAHLPFTIYHYTNSLERSPSLQATSCAATQELPNITIFVSPTSWVRCWSCGDHALSSGMWHRVVWYTYTNISEEASSSIFRVEYYRCLGRSILCFDRLTKNISPSSSG
jgi:hypothetical protein